MGLAAGTDTTRELRALCYDKRAEPIWYFISASGWRIPDGCGLGTPGMDVISVRTFSD